MNRIKKLEHYQTQFLIGIFMLGALLGWLGREVSAAYGWGSVAWFAVMVGYIVAIVLWRKFCVWRNDVISSVNG